MKVKIRAHLSHLTERTRSLLFIWKHFVSFSLSFTHGHTLKHTYKRKLAVCPEAPQGPRGPLLHLWLPETRGEETKNKPFRALNMIWNLFYCLLYSETHSSTALPCSKALKSELLMVIWKWLCTNIQQLLSAQAAKNSKDAQSPGWVCIYPRVTPGNQADSKHSYLWAGFESYLWSMSFKGLKGMRSLFTNTHSVCLHPSSDVWALKSESFVKR